MSKKSKSRDPLPQWFLDEVQVALDQAVLDGTVLMKVVDGQECYALPEWFEDDLETPRG